MSAPVCNVTGRLVDINGAPLIFEIVTWRLDSAGNQPVFSNGDALGTREFPLQTGDNGEFSINLLQGHKYVLKIDALKLHRQVTIPEQASATLEEVLNADV